MKSRLVWTLSKSSGSGKALDTALFRTGQTLPGVVTCNARGHSPRSSVNKCLTPESPEPSPFLHIHHLASEHFCLSHDKFPSATVAVQQWRQQFPWSHSASQQHQAKRVFNLLTEGSIEAEITDCALRRSLHCSLVLQPRSYKTVCVSLSFIWCVFFNVFVFKVEIDSF